MNPTDQTLMQQMHISSEEIEYRKSLLSLTNKELLQLVQLGIKLEPLFDQVVMEFLSTTNFSSRNCNFDWRCRYLISFTTCATTIRH